jgi:hypothetical protein
MSPYVSPPDVHGFNALVWEIVCKIPAGQVATYGQIAALIAPRPVLFMNGEEDATSPPDGIHAIEQAVQPAYALYGKQADFQITILWVGTFV